MSTMSKKAGKWVEVLTSIKDLKPEDFPEGARLETSDLEVDLGDIDLFLGDTEETKKVEEGAKGIRKWVETYLAKLDELRNAPKAMRIRQENKAGSKKIWDKIDSFLNHNEAAYRQAAWIAFLVYRFRHVDVQTYTETMDFLNQMVTDGYLEEGNDHAPLQAWERYFRVPEIASFTRPEFEEAKHALSNLVNRVTQTTAQRRNDRVAELQEEATLQPKEAFGSDKKGIALLYVPPQISKNGDKLFPRKEGFLLIEVTSDGRVFPLEGIGSFEEGISEAVSVGVFVKTYTLNWDWPPAKKKLIEMFIVLDKNYKEATPEEKERIEKKAKRKADAVHLCWHLLKRAKNALEQAGQHQEEKMKLSKEVSVIEDSFLLENQEGIALIDFEGTWETWTKDDQGKSKKEQIGPLFVLVERHQDIVHIVGCPEYLKDFFSSCMDEYEEGEKFLGVPQPLQSVLQAQYGAVQTKSLLSPR